MMDVLDVCLWAKFSKQPSFERYRALRESGAAKAQPLRPDARLGAPRSRGSRSTLPKGLALKTES